jgi:hypothetical protein
MEQHPALGHGTDRPGFGTAVLAVFLAGIVGGAVTTAIGAGHRWSFGDTKAILLIVFVGVLIGAAALLCFLRIAGWSVSPVVAVGTVAAAHLASLVASGALAHAEVRAVRRSPTVLPGLGFGFTAAGVLVGLGVLFVEAWIVQVRSTRRAI